jgi:hypothetical protein
MTDNELMTTAQAATLRKLAEAAYFVSQNLRMTFPESTRFSASSRRRGLKRSTTNKASARRIEIIA